MKRLTAALCLITAILFGSEGRGSDLASCKPTIYKSETLLWDKCVGSWEYKSTNSDKTAVYEGEWKDGKWSGQGSLTVGPTSKFAREKYVGEFRDGKKNGYGIYNFANGDKYIGKWKGNKRTGQGTYSFVNGDKYVGEFRDSKIAGKGIYTFANGKIIVGIFKDGRLSIPKKISR